MRKTQRVAIIVFMLLPVLIFLPACSKKTTETGASDSTQQQEDLEAQKAREQLARERRERETKAREFRSEKIKFMYEDVYFKKGSYQLTPEARQLLQTKAQWLQRHSDVKVVIEGHTDEAGSVEYNLALGDRRAGAVKSFLIGQGINPGRLIAVSYGNEKPISTGSMESAKSKNRRVHFVVEE